MDYRNGYGSLNCMFHRHGSRVVQKQKEVNPRRPVRICRSCRLLRAPVIGKRRSIAATVRLPAYSFGMEEQFRLTTGDDTDQTGICGWPGERGSVPVPTFGLDRTRHPHCGAKWSCPRCFRLEHFMIVLGDDIVSEVITGQRTFGMSHSLCLNPLSSSLDIPALCKWAIS